MPLPPLPENNTARLFLHYTSGVNANSQEHLFTIRFDAAATSPAEIMSALASGPFRSEFLTATYEGWKFLRAEVQAAAAISRFPTPVLPALLGYIGTGLEDSSPAEEAREVKAIGRGTGTGRKVSLSLYGVNTNEITEVDFRFNPPVDSFLGELLDVANTLGLAGEAFINIGHGPTIWYPYVNWQYNSHWERAQRK